MAISRDPRKLFISIDNVRPDDAIALMKMFKYMERLGNVGSSRFCSFYADGDGSFHPKVSFVYPVDLPEIPDVDGVQKDGSFKIDSDAIAWRIYHDPEPEGFVKDPNPQGEATQLKSGDKLNNK
jgi:hypothetical protein